MSDQRLSKFSISSLIFGFGLLYVPILILYSFNDSRLVIVWSGFSFKSYFKLFQDQQILDAAWLSLEIAFLCACMSLILGLMASLSLVRFGRLRGHMTFAGMITAPLVMPEVITGHVHVSLLDKKGRNIFQGKDPSGSPELRYAVQELRSTLSESMLI
jgi:putrescine transport system permease protein